MPPSAHPRQDRPRQRRRAAAAVALLGLAATALAAPHAGCTALVDPENLVVRCQVEAGEDDPCEAIGLSCVAGVCEQCQPSLEKCDGRDNDCDRAVDEGHDVDGDGFTWCGGGIPELVDCVPEDPAIHPATQSDLDGSATVEERCDGKDNDCDGDIDESPLCDQNQQCVPGGCIGELICDEDRGQCVAPQAQGSRCSSDAECAGGFCVSTSAIGLDQLLVASFCATACCTDSDCSGGGVCVQPGTGARVCLPPEIGGRQAREEGQACFGSAECASGVCLSGECRATCTRDTDCSAGVCRLNVLASGLLSGAGSWVCGESRGGGEVGDRCTAFDPNACRSGLCRDTSCAGPCASDADCGAGRVCDYVTVQGLLGGGRVTACVPAASERPGTPCCTNAECAASETCRPVREQDEWGMFCR